MFLITSISLGHGEVRFDKYDNGPCRAWISGPSSVGKIGVKFNVLYQGGKTIKYCRITCVPINAVGDVVACNLGHHVEMRYDVTGPITSGSDEWYFEDGWYNSTIKKVHVEKVDIKYTDGSVETISGKELAENLRTVRRQQQQQEEERERWWKEHRVLRGVLGGLFALLVIIIAEIIGYLWKTIFH